MIHDLRKLCHDEFRFLQVFDTPDNELEHVIFAKRRKIFHFHSVRHAAAFAFPVHRVEKTRKSPFARNTSIRFYVDFEASLAQCG